MHLLNLVQVTDSKDLPPVWEALVRASKHQQLLVLRRAPDALLLQHRHRHRLLLSHLPGIYPSINRAAGTHIAKTVREVAVELRETRL